MIQMTKTFASVKRVRITSGTREWADRNINCIEGCYNNCRYCYAKLMAKRFGRSTEATWRKMKIRSEVLKKNFRKCSGRIMFPSAHDIFDISPFKEACFIVLMKLLKSENDVLITTKPRLALIEEISSEFSQYREQIQFRFTITSINDELLQFWEPNAPKFNERLACLKLAFTKEFRTSVSIEPFLDYDPSELVEIITPFITESIWLGRMNHISRMKPSANEKTYFDQIHKNYKTHHLLELVNKLKAHPKIRLKDSIRLQLDTDTHRKR